MSGLIRACITIKFCCCVSAIDHTSDRFNFNTGYSPLDGPKHRVKDWFPSGRMALPTQ
jgi:hypothetical protein